MRNQKILALAAFLLAIAIILGAFGAHALAGRLTEYQLDIWQKANFYHVIHSLGLFAITILVPLNLLNERNHRIITIMLLVGIFVFSGSLYALALTNIKLLGAFTPIGGLSFILGWLYLGWSLIGTKHS